MNGKFLLDTNIVAAFLNGDANVRKKASESEGIAVPVVAMAELYFGAEHSRNAAANIARLDHYADDFLIVDVDVGTAREYGRIRNRLKTIGKPIPFNDVWIAATAIQHGFILVTRDAHFQHVQGILLEAW